MAKGIAFGIGRLGLRLALAFLAVALASIIVLGFLTEISTGRDINAFIRHRQLIQTRAVAVAAGALYQQPPLGWQHANLIPLVELIRREGNIVKIRDSHDTLVAATGDPHLPADASRYTVPVVVSGRRVGSVTLMFHSRSLGTAVRHFESERLRASLTAAGIVALLALAVSLLVSRQITLPLERLLAVIRVRGGGDRSARVKQVPRAGVVRELGVALNEASDAIDERDRLRRNLVANIAHELRTPVAVLQASHEAMLDGITAMVPANVSSLREEVVRLARKIDDLQRLAAAEAAAVQLHLTYQDLSAVAADVADTMAESYAATGLHLERQLTSTPVRCDLDRMREVIVNLLTNARKFTPAGGHVALAVRPDAPGLATLTVRDSGIGIPAEDLPRITERFFRSDSSAQAIQGSGIGLTIVSELVQAQHGNLDITSKPGEGTQVTITFPRARRPA
ncbi:MAG TPA: ATP-binding protein [Streptosporangiaceae bacterium]|nr:ATP-binding protein [Streptosporangiaceae bacterium]